MRNADRARKVGEEDQARLQRCDEQRLSALVVGRDLLAELTDPVADLAGRDVDVADPFVQRR